MNVLLDKKADVSGYRGKFAIKTLEGLDTYFLNQIPFINVRILIENKPAIVELMRCDNKEKIIDGLVSSFETFFVLNSFKEMIRSIKDEEPELVDILSRFEKIDFTALRKGLITIDLSSELTFGYSLNEVKAFKNGSLF